MKTLLAEIRAELIDIQWDGEKEWVYLKNDDEYLESYCPSCGNGKKMGHTNNCNLIRLVKEIEKIQS